MSTTLPRSSAGVSGGELIHGPPPSKEGRLPSMGSGIDEVIIGFMGVLHSVGVLTEPTAELASIAARKSRVVTAKPLQAQRARYAATGTSPSGPRRTAASAPTPRNGN